MPLPLPSRNDSLVQSWKSEHRVPCSFCRSARVPDPNMVIVSLESGNDSVSICEACIKGAICAAAREFRVQSERSPPRNGKRKRVVKQ